MGFWGNLVTRENPISINFDSSLGRLQVSKATLEERDKASDDHDTLCSNTKLYCQLGDKQPIALCSLSRFKEVMCDLNLQFTGNQDAVFSVRGPHDIAVSGFYLEQCVAVTPHACNSLEFELLGAHLRKMIEVERSKHSSVVIEDITTPRQTTRLLVDQNDGQQRTEDIEEKNLHDVKQLTNPSSLERNDGKRRKKRKRNLDKVQFPVDEKEKTEKTERDNTITTAEGEDWNYVKEGGRPFLIEQKTNKTLRKKHRKKTKEQSEAANEVNRQSYHIEDNQQSDSVIRAEEKDREDCNDVKEGDHPLLSEQKPKKTLRKKHKKKTKEQSEVADEATKQSYHIEDNQQSHGVIIAKEEDFNDVKEGDHPLLSEQKLKKKLPKKHKKKTEEQSEAPNEATKQSYHVEDNQQSHGVIIIAEEEDCNDVKEGDHPLLSEQKPKKKLRKKHKEKTEEQLEAPHEATRHGYHIEDNQQSDGVILAVCVNRMKGISPSEIRADAAIATGEASPIVEEASSEDYDMMVQSRKKVKGYKNVGIENRNPLAHTNKQDNAARGEKNSNMFVLALPVSVVPIPKPKRCN